MFLNIDQENKRSMNFFFIRSKVDARYQSDIILAISKKHNHQIIIIKILRIKYFNNVYFFAIRIAIIIIIIFTTMFLYVLHFD